MTKGIWIYVEGGGRKGGPKADKNRQSKFRVGFNSFLAYFRSKAQKKDIDWFLIPCGPRWFAYDEFINAVRENPDAAVILLVDSERPVSKAPWEHLAEEPDSWSLTEDHADQCHLMVQAMEAWMMTDLDALSEYFGSGFRPEKIPDGDVVDIPKNRLENALRAASRKSERGVYQKMPHGPEIMSKLDISKVRKAALHCDSLFSCLERIIQDA